MPGWRSNDSTALRCCEKGSFQGTRTPALAQRANRWLWYGSAAAAVVTIGLVLWHFTGGRPYDPAAVSFDDTSDHLEQTVIVPTLDSPIPEGQSAIWCVSFQLAWNHLKDDVAKEPLKLTNAQPIADRLNRADHSEADVSPDAVYAAAGLAKDGIVKHIRAQMAGKFPNVPRPQQTLGVLRFSRLSGTPAPNASELGSFGRRRAQTMEAMWVRSSDPKEMLTFLPLSARDPRKARLVAVACCRRVPAADPRSLAAVDVAERFADGQASEDERRAAEAAPGRTTPPRQSVVSRLSYCGTSSATPSGPRRKRRRSGPAAAGP
jgi:hypothetical protein